MLGANVFISSKPVYIEASIDSKRQKPQNRSKDIFSLFRSSFVHVGVTACNVEQQSEETKSEEALVQR